MSHDHIGIPRFIQEGFATSGIVASYDTALDIIRTSPISKLGTSVDYYDEDVEKDLLANKVEGEFSKLYHDITSTKDLGLIEKTIIGNKTLIAQFFSFMYMRAKKMVDTVNQNSLSSKIFGNVDHSELLRIQANIFVDPLKMIGEEYFILPVLNFSRTRFINNSLGIGALITNTKTILFYVPLNDRLGLIFCDKDYCGDSQFFYIWQDGEATAKRLNNSIVQFEYEYGNGFLFGMNKSDLKDSIDYFRSMKEPATEQ